MPGLVDAVECVSQQNDGRGDRTTTAPSSKPTVAILGGGVGGLSAAHELAERGFAVTVYERQATFGGKARSMSVPGSGTGGRKDLPGEHGFRFFPGFYKHITDTMRRIPFGGSGASCADNLVLATRILLARAGKADPLWIARFPETLDDFRTAFRALFDHLDIPDEEIAFFVTRLLGLATSCEERYLEEFEHTAFWDFIGARTRSENYQRYLAQGMTRSLVAMRAEESSTRTVGRILLQLFYGILVPGGVFDRLLTGPTNDVWIDPWRRHLAGRLGVALLPNATLRSFNLAGDRLRGVTVERDGRLEEVTADFYVAAVPLEVMQGSSRRAGACRAVALEARRVADRMDERHPVLPPHRSAAGERAYRLSRFELGAHLDLAGPVLERLRPVAVRQRAGGRHSLGRHLELDRPGQRQRQAGAQAATRDEIKDEVWAQLKAALNGPERLVLEDGNLVDWFLDPDIQLPNPGVLTNAEPLLINHAGSLALRPEAYTEVGNLLLAADYVRTYTDLATMEAANEAARRATNAILAMSGVHAPPCGLWEFDIPNRCATRR